MGVSVEDLNTLKVAEIKEHLKKMDLATTGFKKELVDRLKEAMESKGLTELVDDKAESEEVKEASPAVAIPAEEAKPEEEQVKQEEIQPVEEKSEDVQPKEEVLIPEIPKVSLSLDEIKEKVIEHIKMSISRCEKFQEEDKIKRLTKDLHRIEKFGIAENNPIAIELGLVEPEKPKFRHRKQGGKAKKNNKRYHPYRN